MDNKTYLVYQGYRPNDGTATLYFVVENDFDEAQQLFEDSIRDVGNKNRGWYFSEILNDDEELINNLIEHEGDLDSSLLDDLTILDALELREIGHWRVELEDVLPDAFGEDDEEEDEDE